jgi:uncharacterized protein (DUF2062 family)
MTERDKILASRWLRPFAHLFSHPSLWHLNRRSVPRALAIGLFAAFILPVGQFVLAALLAVGIRANVPLAAAATLVSNPLTFPPIYIGAYKVGSAVLGSGPIDAVANDLGSKLLNVSGPTALGLLIFALAGAALGFLLGTLWWRLKLVRRWKGRGD